jgi:hypothetical protein
MTGKQDAKWSHVFTPYCSGRGPLVGLPVPVPVKVLGSSCRDAEPALAAVLRQTLNPGNRASDREY